MTQANNEQWQALHNQLQDALAGYADNELDEHERAQVEAHLAGCEACRLDLAHQQLINQRLQQIPLTGLSAQMHQRLDQVIKSAPPAPRHRLRPQQGWRSFFLLPWRRKLSGPLIAATSGWAVALVLLVILISPSLKTSTSNAAVPMVQDVLAQYQYYHRSALPVSSHGAKIQPPASWPGSHVLASWQTNIGGAPAQAFAVRNGDSIILQFRVDESVFFHHPDIRRLVARQGQFEMQRQDLTVLGIPLSRAGLLMVGPANGIPPPDKLTLNKSVF
jgi:anti-sigma factor RsiW